MAKSDRVVRIWVPVSGTQSCDKSCGMRPNVLFFESSWCCGCQKLGKNVEIIWSVAEAKRNSWCHQDSSGTIVISHMKEWFNIIAERLLTLFMRIITKGVESTIFDLKINTLICRLFLRRFRKIRGQLCCSCNTSNAGVRGVAATAHARPRARGFQPPFRF